MKNIKFKGTFWSESEKSFCCLVISNGVDENEWTGATWFPKKICRFIETGYLNRVEIEAPEWYLKKNNIFDKIKIIS